MKINQPVVFVIILTSLLVLLHKASNFTQLLIQFIEVPDQEQQLRRNDDNGDGGEFESVSLGINVSIGNPYISYKGSQVEKYVINHANSLGFNSENNPLGCSIWTDESPILRKLTAFRDDLKTYQQLVHDFPDAPQDIRKAMETSSVEHVCS